ADSRFFFSSRRRHTRFSRDWSSDVCSSDLGRTAADPDPPAFQLDWRPPERGASIAPAEAGARFGLRPPGSVDPFRLFYPDSGDGWRWAAHVKWEARVGQTVWEAVAHRAAGSPRGDEGVWGSVRGRT